MLLAAPDSVTPGLGPIRHADFCSCPIPPDPIVLLDWNIDRGVNFDDVATSIERAHPTVCLLQEVDLHTNRASGRDVAAELARRLGMNYVFAPSFQELGQGSSEKPAYQGLAILARYPLRDARVIRFQAQSGFWRPRSYLPDWPFLQRRLGGRIALVATLETGHLPITVYNLHLESRSFGRIQAHQLREAVDDAARLPAGSPVILGGDFNTKYLPGIFERRLVSAGYRNAIPRSGHTHKVVGLLDWIFVRGPLDARSGSVLRHATGSDHFPVAATFDWTRPAPSPGPLR